jgi:hypothetical protein
MHCYSRLGVKRDGFSGWDGRISNWDSPDRAAVDLVGTPEVPLERQLAAACDQHGMDIGIARGSEPIRDPAQRATVDEFILIDGGDGPAVVSRERNTAAVGRVRVHGQRGERCQRSSTEK